LPVEALPIGEAYEDVAIRRYIGRCDVGYFAGRVFNLAETSRNLKVDTGRSDGNDAPRNRRAKGA
jgi:hypothetical protein